MKFSIVVPYLSKSKYIDSFKKYLKLNTVNEYELIEIIDETDVYYAYNKGVFTANNDIVILMNDDMIVGESWDVNYIKYANPEYILTGYIVEPSPGYNNPKSVKTECGKNIETFDYDKFSLVVSQAEKQVPDILYDIKGWYMPLCVNRRTFIGYPNFKKFPDCANDVILIDYIMPNLGFKFGLVSSFVYHFQAKSWCEEIKPEYIRPIGR